MSDEKTYQEVLAFLEKRRARTVEDVFNEYLDQKPEGKANAVEVPVRGTPRPILVQDFSSDSKVVSPEYLTALEAQLEFPVCCISGWHPEDGSENRLISHFIHLLSVRGTCLICGYDNGKPAPLTDEQAQFACDVLAYAEILKARGEL